MRERVAQHESKVTVAKAQAQPQPEPIGPQRGPSGVTAAFLSFQRLHGNRFVQRVLDQARRAGGDGSAQTSEAPLAELTPAPTLARLTVIDDTAEDEMRPLMQPANQLDDLSEQEPAAVYRVGSNGAIQTQLKLGTPGDVYEQEAENVAAHMAEAHARLGTHAGGLDLDRFPSHASPGSNLASVLGLLGALPRATAYPMNSNGVPLISRFSSECLREDTAIPAPLETRVQQSKGQGNRLPFATRRTMEGLMGYHFGHVRVKADAEAADLCQQLHARAFTHGADIWMGRDESVNDVKILAHELTHVVQQGAAPPLRRETTPLLERAALDSDVLSRVQALASTGAPDASLYHREILQFQQEQPAERVALLRTQMLESNAAADIRGQESDPTVRLAYGGGGAPAVTFPTITTIAADATVERERAADWTAGLSDYKERAGWMMWDSVANTYAVVNKTIGTEDGVNPGATPADSGTTYCVAHYHQHPPLRPGRAGVFPVGPSAADTRFANGRNSPGIVRDYTDTTRTTVTNYEYGPARRA